MSTGVLNMCMRNVSIGNSIWILELAKFWPNMGMPGHVGANMWHWLVYLCLLLIEFFQHAKYGPIFLSGSWNIQNWKMVQSDWLRAIFKISWEPDLSQTCDFRWIMQDTELNRFKIKKYKLFNNIIGESVISVRYGHAWACLGRHVTSWNISMTSS